MCVKFFYLQMWRPDGKTKHTQTLMVWRFLKKALLLWTDIKSVLSLWIPLSPWGRKWQGVNLLCLPFWWFPPPPTLHTNPRIFAGGACSAWLGSHQSHQSIRAHGLGALQGEAQGSTPHQLGQHAEGSGHAEQHSVVVHLGHSVVLRRQREQSQACISVARYTNAQKVLRYPAVRNDTIHYFSSTCTLSMSVF